MYKEEVEKTKKRMVYLPKDWTIEDGVDCYRIKDDPCKTITSIPRRSGESEEQYKKNCRLLGSAEKLRYFTELAIDAYEALAQVEDSKGMSGNSATLRDKAKIMADFLDWIDDGDYVSVQEYDKKYAKIFNDHLQTQET